MYIKPQTVIPANFNITKCPPRAAAGISIYQLEREHEMRLLEEAEKVTIGDLINSKNERRGSE